MQPAAQPARRARKIPLWNIPAQLATTLPLGLLDGAVGFAYLLHIGIVKWHAAVLASKLILVLFRMRNLKTIPQTGMIMLGSILLIIAASLVSGINGIGPIAAALGFTAEFVVTLAIIDATPPAETNAKSEAFRLYAAGVACAIGVTATIHFVMAHTGHIPALWGRYLYFNWTQPNEGGEMAAAGAIAAMLGLPRWRSVALTMILMADTMLLQNRSGIIAEALCILVRLCFDDNQKLYKSSSVFIGVGVVLLAIKGMLFGMDDPILSHVSSALMMEDHYRGVGSGFSGRSGLWDIAIQLFNESPIIGHGLGYYDSIGFIGPHNIVLYGLGEYGLTSLPFLCAIAYAYYLKSKRELYIFLVLMCSVPLLLFNDRFLDLNPYPFVIYIFLAATSADRFGRTTAAVSPGRGSNPAVRRAAVRTPRRLPIG